MNIDCLICDIDRNADDLLSLYRSRFKLNPIDKESSQGPKGEIHNSSMGGVDR